MGNAANSNEKSRELNSARIKLELTIQGVRLDPGFLMADGRFHRKRESSEYIPPGVELVLPGDMLAEAPVGEQFCDQSPYLLTVNNGKDGFLLKKGELDIPVKVVPEPEYHRRYAPSGRPLHQIGTVQAGYISIDPSSQCGYTLRGVGCAFCTVGNRSATGERFVKPLEDVIEAIREAFDEGIAEYVVLSSGFLNTEDRGIKLMEPYIKAIKKHFDTFVAIQVIPPEKDSWIAEAYAYGADALAFNLEFYDQEYIDKFCPGRSRYVSQDRYFDALQAATEIFPKGCVYSNLIVGLEPYEATKAGIDRLTEMGVLPFLSTFRPLTGTPLAEYPLPDPDELEDAYLYLYRQSRDRSIPITWIRNLTLAATPLDGRMLAGEDPRMAKVIEKFYKTRLGGKAARTLSGLRRKLKVKEVSDAFDSSSL